MGVFGLNGWSNASLFLIGFKMLLESGKPLTRANLVDVMETMRDASVGGARGVSYRPDDHRGSRQEGIIQARNGNSFELVRNFMPYPADVFNAKLS